MNENILDKAERIAKDHSHRWYGFFAISFLLMSAALTFYGLLPTGKIRFLYYGYAMLALEVLVLAWWLIHVFWIRKCKKEKTGVVVCIYADTAEVEQSLRRDFISALQKQLTDTAEIQDVFDVNVIKNHIAIKYNTPGGIKRLHTRTRGHIYIFGETKKRRNGDEQYFLSLSGWVLHKPVPSAISNELSRDFSITLPSNINFQEVFAFRGFSISADIVTKSVQYIAGIASFISGNPFLALRLHEDLRRKVINTPVRFPGDQAISSKLGPLLADEYAIVASIYFNNGDRLNTNSNLEKAIELNQLCYRAKIVESMIAFCWENDPQKALGAIQKCRDVSDPLWRYNDAFLRFWLGQYPSALKQCEKITKQNHPTEFAISQEVTSFNEGLFKNNNGKPALYFWLGFNYLRKQNNLPLALQNLEQFINDTNPSDVKLAQLRQKAEGWLVEIKRQGDWK